MAAGAEVERLVADFFELVALAIDNAEARDALAASRRRLLDSGDATRKLIEEALHAGPRRRLVSVALASAVTGSPAGAAHPPTMVLLAAGPQPLSANAPQPQTS